MIAIGKSIQRRALLRSGAAFAIAAGCTAAIATPRRTDPLNQPAADVGKAAASSRLVAITNAGARLVAAGAGGLVIFSDDAGATWRQAAVPVSCDLTALHFRSTRQGWAVGHDGIVLRTLDGGASWVKTIDGNGIAARIKSYYGERAGAAGLGPEFMAEVNRIAAAGADKPLLDISFVSDSEGFAVGAFNLVLRTVDGGSSWQPLLERTDNPKALHLYALAIAQKTLFMAGEQGTLRRWNAQAEAFASIQSPYPGSFFGLLATDRTLFAFGLQGNAFRTSDGGETWKQLRSAGVAAVTAAVAMKDGRLVFATQNGRLLLTADEGEHWSEIQRARSTPCFGLARAGDAAIALAGPAGIEIARVP